MNAIFKVFLVGWVALNVVSSAIGADKEPVTYSSVDRPGSKGYREIVDKKMLRFERADLAQVLERYEQLSQRAIIRGADLPANKFTFKTVTRLSRVEALRALDTLLAQNGVTMIPQGTKFVKAVAPAMASGEAAPELDWPASELPDSATYIQYRVQIRIGRPRSFLPSLQPFAKMPNSIVAMDDLGLIILRDYSANIRRMLPLIETIEHRQRLDAERKNKAEEK